MKLPIASYTFLNTWGICPHQAARRYIIKDLPKEPESPAMKWGNEVHQAMAARLGGGKLPDHMPYESFAAPIAAMPVQPEVDLGMTEDGQPCEFFGKHVYLRGKLDAPIVIKHAAMLYDFKTGKQREDPYELEIGALLLQAKYPQLNRIMGQYIWLKDMKVGQMHDCSDTARTWKTVQNTMNEVATAIEHSRFAKVKGPLCGYCPVVDCEHNRRGK